MTTPAENSAREQAPEDHRVGDVAHRELVEAQERRLAREIGGDRGDGSSPVTARPCAPAAIRAAALDVGHEGVEMGPAFLRPSTAAKNRSISMVLPRPTAP